jgi:hypothetical protein
MPVEAGGPVSASVLPMRIGTPVGHCGGNGTSAHPNAATAAMTRRTVFMAISGNGLARHRYRRVRTRSRD